MTDYKIQSMADLEAEMRAAARGEKAAPEDARSRASSWPMSSSGC